MGKDKDFSIFIKTVHVVYCFSPVLFIAVLKALGKKTEK